MFEEATDYDNTIIENARADAALASVISTITDGTRRAEVLSFGRCVDIFAEGGVTPTPEKILNLLKGSGLEPKCVPGGIGAGWNIEVDVQPTGWWVQFTHN